MTGWHLGIDTSNYTTSAALYDADSGRILQKKMPLPVKAGALGLRQSDAVFAHTKQLGALLEALFSDLRPQLSGVGVSARPRDAEGSYMPCFLVGETVAQSIAAASGVPLARFSHQAGHIAAALYSAGQLSLTGTRFVAFHVSGGTTEAVLVAPGSAQQPFVVTPFAVSLDLKAGQAVDRVGAMLGLPFPAGMALEALARRSKNVYKVKAVARGTDCSLSGIENRCQKMLRDGDAPCDIARFCIDSILAALRHMTKEARAAHPGAAVVYSGGVMSNAIIREAITAEFGGYFAEPQFSSDNAAGAAVLSSLCAAGEQKT